MTAGFEIVDDVISTLVFVLHHCPLMIVAI